MEIFDSVYPILRDGTIINIHLLDDTDKYGLSRDGRVWSRCISGEWKPLHPFKGNRQGLLFVDIHGESRSVKHLFRIMFGGRRHMNVGNRNGMAKLSNYKVFSILTMRKNGATHEAIARKFNLHESAVSMILSGKRWGHLRQA